MVRDDIVTDDLSDDSSFFGVHHRVCLGQGFVKALHSEHQNHVA